MSLISLKIQITVKTLVKIPNLPNSLKESTYQPKTHFLNKFAPLSLTVKIQEKRNQYVSLRLSK